MNNFVIAGSLLGLLLTIPMCVKILKKESAQNPLTYFLWSVLDIINASAAYSAGGNWFLPACFTVAGLAVVACILKVKGQMKWTKFETLITLMAVLCIAIWNATTDVWAALATLCALSIASIPQIVDTHKKPKDTPTLIYMGFFVANFLNLIGGKEISIVEIGYPFASASICLSIIIFSLRKPKVGI